MRIGFACAIVAACLTVGAGAQTRPVFTGTWKFVGEKSTPSDRPVFGSEIRISHEANALVLELPVREFVRIDGRDQLVERGLGAPMAYKTDGEQHMMLTDRKLVSYATDGPYRVSWSGAALNIAGGTVIPFMRFSQGGTVEIVRLLYRTSFSANPDGTLVIERTAERDPADKGQIEVRKAVVKSVYRKTS
jgi:hypothetical protein